MSTVNVKEEAKRLIRELIEGSYRIIYFINEEKDKSKCWY